MNEWFRHLALVDYFVRGGFWMWPLLICSLLGLAVILYKAYTLWRAGRTDPGLLEQVERLVEQGRTQEAQMRCAASPTPVGELLSAILRAAGRGPQHLREVAEVAGAQQLAVLEYGLPSLGTIATVAPLLGFLGTVSGMIHAFQAIAVRGLGDPGTVASGISEALITTATGLIIAIPCAIGYGYFTSVINGLRLQMETAGTHLLHLLVGEGRAHED